MKLKTPLYLLLLAFILVSCTSKRQSNDLLDQLIAGKIREYTIPNKSSLRGVDVLDGQVVWVSGSKGTYARSIDGGISWKVGNINNDTLLDFRDIQAFTSESAIAISAGSPAKIYKTDDGGETWNLKYSNTDSVVFFDSFDFYDKMNGIACSDPIRGNFFFIKTSDGGETWDTINFNNLPKPLKVEGGFAASGTSVVYSSNGTILFGTGGDEARVIVSHDFGEKWEAITTPTKSGEASFGIYAIAELDEKTFMVTGGCWKKPEEAFDNVAISDNSGKSWKLTKSFPSGFRSAIKYLKQSKAIITCGINGVDISEDMGETWTKTPMQGYNAIDISTNSDFIVFVGPKGKIAFVSSKTWNVKG